MTRPNPKNVERDEGESSGCVSGVACQNERYLILPDKVWRGAEAIIRKIKRDTVREGAKWSVTWCQDKLKVERGEGE